MSKNNKVERHLLLDSWSRKAHKWWKLYYLDKKNPTGKEQI